MLKLKVHWLFETIYYKIVNSKFLRMVYNR